MEGLVKLLLGGLSLFTIVGFWAKHLMKGLENRNDEARKRHIDTLRQGHFVVAYKDYLNKGLKRLAKVIGDERHFTDETPAARGLSAWIARPFKLHLNPWSGASYQFCLLLAFLYPLLAVLILWSLGGVGEVGGIVLLPDVDSEWGPVGVLALIGGSGWGLYQFINNEGIKSWLWLGCFFGGAWGLGVFIGASAGAAAITFAGAFVFAVAVAVAFAVAVAVAGAGAGAGAVAVAVAVADVVVVVVVVVVAVAVALIYLQKFAKNKSAESLFLTLQWVLFLGLALCSLFYFSGQEDGLPVTSQILLLFMVLFPLINAPLDWLSLGVTRGLLHAIVEDKHRGWQPFSWALIDFILAIIFLFLMVASLTLMVALANWASVVGGGGATI